MEYPKTADRRAKRTQIWDSGYYSAHSITEVTFDAPFLGFGLGSLSTLCKISNFYNFLIKLCSFPRFSGESSKLYTRYPNHTGYYFFGDFANFFLKNMAI